MSLILLNFPAFYFLNTEKKEKIQSCSFQENVRDEKLYCVSVWSIEIESFLEKNAESTRLVCNFFY